MSRNWLLGQSCGKVSGTVPDISKNYIGMMLKFTKVYMGLVPVEVFVTAEMQESSYHNIIEVMN